MRCARLLAGLAAGAVLAGCGESLCHRAQDTYNRFNQNAVACGYSDSTVVFDESACDSDEDACSSDDETIINAYFDCLNGVPTCDPSNPDAWASAASACGTPTVSNDVCAAAVNPE